MRTGERVTGVRMYPNLKLQLWRSGIRQNRFARLIGIDETMLSKIVNGFREPNPQLRTRIATVLQSDETWLFERMESPDQRSAANGTAGSQ